MRAGEQVQFIDADESAVTDHPPEIPEAQPVLAA